jgi:hypothetical protein
MVKDATNLASLYGSHIDRIDSLCEKDKVGVGKDIKAILKLYKNELRL